MKYMLDKLIITSVNTTIKSDLCVMYHSVTYYQYYSSATP